MRTFKANLNLLALLAVAATCASGCHKTVDSELVGTWDIAKVQSLANRMNLEANAAEAAGEPSRMSLNFQSTGVLKTVTQLGKIDSVKTGSWKLLQEDPKEKTTIECSIGGLTSRHEVRWLDDATIRLAPPNMSGQKMIMKFVRRE
jgi:hypothetical protein